MEIQKYIDDKKQFYDNLLAFVDDEECDDEEYDKLCKLIENQYIQKNQTDFINIVKIIKSVSDYHHRRPDFIKKIERILLFIKDKIKQALSNDEIYILFQSNKQIVLFLFKENIIVPTQNIWDQINFMQEPYLSLFIDFYIPEFDQFLNDEEKKKIDEWEEYEQKRLIGENDSYICELIREDSVVEFISFVNKKKISLESTINHSIFETNVFLIDKTPTLIEYASFFGSIQIVRYLIYNKVKITNSVWIYAIHSNNAELFHLLEENETNFSKKLLISILKESFKCHHNDIATYIENNLISLENIKKYKKKEIVDSIVNSFNYYFYPVDVCSIITQTENIYNFKIFNLCTSISKITIPSSVKIIGEESFEKCSFLTEISIPSSVTTIEKNAFFDCHSLKQVFIEEPSFMTLIKESAFGFCSSLTQIKIPSSVITIESRAFEGCSSLTQITIPSSVTSIELSAFEDCTSLKQITFTSSSINSIEYRIFNGCSSLTQIIIPSSVTSIEQSSFEGCSSLTQITIPSSVTLIGYFAFTGCSSLKKLSFEIPSSLTTIKKDAFKGCSSLLEIEIPSSVTVIENGVFRDCSSLKQISIPSSIDSIDSYTFAKCTSLIHVLIPSSVTRIGDHAFDGCSSLSHINVPSSVVEIGNHAFADCIELAQITVPSNVKMGNHAFVGRISFA